MNREDTDQLISAALDGEDVDVGALRLALGTPEGRNTLAAFVLLRAASAADPMEPISRVAPVIDAAAHPVAARRWFGGWTVPAAVAASLAALAVAGSFWLGTTWRGVEPVPVEIAGPARVPPPPPVVHEPSPVVVTPAARGDCGTTVEQPPKPTRELRFVRGVDWKDLSY